MASLRRSYISYFFIRLSKSLPTNYFLPVAAIVPNLAGA